MSIGLAGPATHRRRVGPLTGRRSPFRADRDADFAKGREPADVVHLHVWPDTTMRELTALIQRHRKNARAPRARVSFALVFPAPSGDITLKRVAVVHARRETDTDTQTLSDVGFRPGDALDVAIFSRL